MALRPEKRSQGKKSAIDWPALHLRIGQARAAAERGWAPDAEQAERILQARARAMAAEPHNTGAVAEQVEVVEFLLAHEKYAVESRHVREVLPLENLTLLPCTPAFVSGIVNVRGEIFSVIDIRKFFDLPDHGLPDRHKIIVLRSENLFFGILADAITGVRQIPLSEIQPSLPTLTGIREDYLKGVTPERTVILDAGKLLADERIIVREEVR
ncbi:MAG: chemotaxis protein CheW [Nitrosomonadales bacterium]|nr:chemotaxis protein CheW [Nitrosomonadales bacterium]